MWFVIALLLSVFVVLKLLYGAAKRQLWVMLPAGGNDGNPFKEPAR